MISSLTIARKSYPNKLSFVDVVERFSVLVKQQPQPDETSTYENIRPETAYAAKKDAENVMSYLLREKMESSTSADDSNSTTSSKPFVIGKNKIYFRAGVLEELESQRITFYDKFARLIQRSYRKSIAKGPIAKKKYEKLRRISLRSDTTVLSKKPIACQCLQMFKTFNSDSKFDLARLVLSFGVSQQWYV